MSQPQPLIRHSLHDMLVAQLRRMITAGDLTPGQKIPEQALCERFGISRTPLREALKVLAAEGILQLMPRRGAVVARLTQDEIEELFPIMAVLEGLAGELAARHASDAQIAHVRGLHQRMVAQYRKGDEPAYLRTNRAIHEAIFDLSGNGTLRLLYQQILTRIHSCRFVVRKSPENWKNAVDEHEQIMEALAARDPQRLGRLLRRHVTGTTVKIAREAVGRADTSASGPATTPAPVRHRARVAVASGI